METKKKTSSSSSSMIPDWSLLPQELLDIISKNVEDCFDILHARSVSSLWRSTFPFPSSLLRPIHSLPTFSESREQNEGSCTLERVPLFLFRVKTPLYDPPALPSEYFLGGIGRDESKELPYTNQCSVKVKIPEYETTSMNMVDCQILNLGYQYRLFGWEPKDYRGVVVLPVNKKGGGEGGEEEEEEFVLLLNSSNVLMVFTSDEMKWKRLENIPQAVCSDIVTFRGKFYVCYLIKKIFSIDPYSLEVNLVMPSPLKSLNYLVPCGDDELYLVEVSIPVFEVINFSRFTCKVSRLDEEIGRWVEVSDLGDRVLFIGRLGNVCCSAKDLPDGCGLSGNSILFTDRPGDITFFYKYRREHNAEGVNGSHWRTSRDNHVVTLNTSPVVAFRVEQ